MQISIETNEKNLARLSAVIVNEREVPGRIGGGEEGDDGSAITRSETLSSRDNSSASGPRFPFSAISCTPGLAASPTLNTLSPRRCVTASGGVNGWPRVSFVTVTRYVETLELLDAVLDSATVPSGPHGASFLVLAGGRRGQRDQH